MMYPMMRPVNQVSTVPIMTQPGQPMQIQPIQIQPIMVLPTVPIHRLIPIYPPVEGVPAGLEALHFSAGLAVHQELNAMELMLPVEMNNRYSVHNSLGQRIYYAAEDTDCCTKCCWGENRAFKVVVYDGQGRPVMHIDRDLGCELCFLGGGIGGSVVTVSLAQGGQLLSTVVQDCDCCAPKYHIVDPQLETVARIEGDSCTCCCATCSSVVFTVTDPKSGGQIGQITRHLKFESLFTDSMDSFGMVFTAPLPVNLKAALLGAIICIDFNFFENGSSGMGYGYGYGDGGGGGNCSCTGLKLVIIFGTLAVIFGVIPLLFVF